MKRLAIVLVVTLGFVPLAFGEPRTVKVEVMNTPLEVEVVNQPQPLQYEYYGLYIGDEGVIPTEWNPLSAEGWELIHVSGNFTPTGAGFASVWRRPVTAE